MPEINWPIFFYGAFGVIGFEAMRSYKKHKRHKSLALCKKKELPLYFLVLTIIMILAGIVANFTGKPHPLAAVFIGFSIPANGKIIFEHDENITDVDDIDFTKVENVNFKNKVKYYYNLIINIMLSF